jgi:hypothetical protein
MWNKKNIFTKYLFISSVVKFPPVHSGLYNVTILFSKKVHKLSFVQNKPVLMTAYIGAVGILGSRTALTSPPQKKLAFLYGPDVPID